MNIYTGDALEILQTMESESVHCCVTSPPYWGLRDYGVNGQLGLEKMPEAYVDRLVAIFAEVRRVLRSDGTLWVNIGDSYAGGGRGNYGNGLSLGQGPKHTNGHNFQANGCKPKDLVGIPWMIAFALRAEGWFLRSDIIWHKPNPMPESVTDRPTKSHEYIFLLSKSERYFYDATAIMEEAAYDGRKDTIMKGSEKYANGFTPVQSFQTVAVKGHERWPNMKDGKQYRNKRSVWSITTKPYSEAHFATFPPELPRLCILAGCPKGGTVLDPFSGAGTTLLVASRLGRDGIGIELNPEYVEMSQRRIVNDAPLFNTIERQQNKSLQRSKGGAGGSGTAQFSFAPLAR